MVLAHSDVVKVLDASADTLRSDNGRAVTHVGLGARYSTSELLALEQRLVTSAVDLRAGLLPSLDATSQTKESR